MASASFFSARAKEITSLASELKKHPERGLSFQNLPYKCRRRAASHHRNRIPSKARKSVPKLDPIGKRPSKKYRKRKSPQERQEKCQKKKMATHVWHAKRFHMMQIEENWVIPQSANEKNFRAVYRSAFKRCYIQDFSYFECVQVTELHVKNGFKTISKGRILTDFEDGDCFLLNGDETVAFAFCLKLDSKDSLWFCHPSQFKNMKNYLEEISEKVQPRPDFCLFHLMGPETHEKLESCAAKVEMADDFFKVLQLGPEEYKIVISKEIGYKLWLQFTHSKTLVGCLKSQEHLDVEMERICSTKLWQDIDFCKQTPEQIELQKLSHHWSKSEKNFKIIRDSITLKEYEEAIENGSKILIGNVPSFLPIVIDMNNGGVIDENSKLYFPAGKIQDQQKFANDILHAAFFEENCVGLVTLPCYSLKRGLSSALGLINADALRTFVENGQIADNKFKIAVEKKSNGKFYVGNFRFLHL